MGNLYYSTRPRDRELAGKIFEQLEGSSDASETTVGKLIGSIRIGKVLRDLSLSAYDVAESRGDLSKVLEQVNDLKSLVEGGDSEGESGAEEKDFDFVTDDLDVLVSDAVSTPGLRWRLNTLNRMLGSLRKGDFGFVFARPETGKTTFLASEVTAMASQLTDESGPIVWFNNEEQGSKVMLRVYQASLGITMVELFRDLKGNKERFYKLTKRKIRMVDDGALSKSKVERICKVLKPSLIIIDQIDKIKGFDNDREDLRLGTIYQWARELAKLYAPTIGVCQADGTGEGQKWLSMAHVANAKTAKQAEADFIIGIGKIHDMGFETIRYLHASKNKLMGDADTVPELRHGRQECILDAERARYVDIG